MYLMTIKYPKSLIIMFLNNKNKFKKNLKMFENNTFLKFLVSTLK